MFFSFIKDVWVPAFSHTVPLPLFKSGIIILYCMYCTWKKYFNWILLRTFSNISTLLCIFSIVDTHSCIYSTFSYILNFWRTYYLLSSQLFLHTYLAFDFSSLPHFGIFSQVLLQYLRLLLSFWHTFTYFLKFGYTFSTFTSFWYQLVIHMANFSQKDGRN